MISSLTNKIRELESRCACFKDGSTRNSFTKVEPTIAKKLADTKTRFIDSKFVESKGRRIDIEVEEFIDEDSHETRQPITAKRIFSDDNTRIEKTQIIISSTGLGNLLRDVLDRYLKHEFQSIFDKNEIVLSNPFIPLEHNWELLQNATTEKKVLQKHGRECVSELKELLNLVHRWAPECTQMWSAIRDSKTVMKEHLYSMFKPGNLVVAMHSDNYAQLMKVHHYGAGSTANLSGTSSVFCEGFDWNGRKLERLRYEFSMPEMESTEQFKVRDLPCCPVEFYEDERGANGIEDLKKSLIKRGQRFEEVCIAQHERKRTYNYLGKFQVEGGLRPSTWPSIFSPQDLADPVRSNLKRISTPPAFLTVWSLS